VQEIILSQTAASTVTEEIRFVRRSEDLRAVRWAVKIRKEPTRIPE
jgi:hypothetical protein